MASKKKYIAHVRTASTDSGVHYWQEWLKCQRLAWLSGIAKANATPGQMSSVDYFRVGSFTHALMALHRSLPADEAMALSTDHIVYKTESGIIDPEEFHEDVAMAETLYRNYKAWWGKLAVIGTPLAIEKDLEMELGEVAPSIIVSGGIDFALRLSKRDVKQLAVSGLEEAGVVLVDYKTAAGPDPYDYELYQHDLQTSTYPQLWDAHHSNPKDKVIGFLIEKMYKKGAKKCERLFIPRRTLDLEWEVTKGMIIAASRERSIALSLIDRGGLPEPRTTHCFRRSRAGWEFCGFYKNNECNRRPNNGDGRRKGLEIV